MADKFGSTSQKLLGVAILDAPSTLKICIGRVSQLSWHTQRSTPFAQLAPEQVYTATLLEITLTRATAIGHFREVVPPSRGQHTKCYF